MPTQPSSSPARFSSTARAPGTISLIVWGGSRRIQYDLVVEQPVSSLEQQLHRLFPGEDVQVGNNDEAIVLSGRASSTQIMLRIGEIARATAAKANVINMLQVPGGTDASR